MRREPLGECDDFTSLICYRTPLQNRQLDGAVHRVPPGFYDKGKNSVEV